MNHGNHEDDILGIAELLLTFVLRNVYIAKIKVIRRVILLFMNYGVEIYNFSSQSSCDCPLYEESQCAQRFLLRAFFLAISFAYFCAAFDYKMAAIRDVGCSCRTCWLQLQS